MKIAYAGLDLLSPVLDTLISMGENIVGVFTCDVDNEFEFNTHVIRTAEENGIPWTCDRIRADDIERLIDSGCEALICAAYYYRIPVTDKMHMINVHPGLLPKGRGSWPMPVKIMRGERESGVTFHKIAESFDTGDIILQRSFALDPREDLETFTQKIRACLPDMTRELMSDLPTLCKSARPQGEGEYLACPDPSQYVLTPDTDASECDRVLRAFAGFECFYDDPVRGRIALFHGRVRESPSINSLPVRGGYIAAERYRNV